MIRTVAEAKIRVCITPAVVGNPYQELLADALRRCGAQVRYADRPTLGYIFKADPSYDVVHLHWPEFILGSNAKGPFADIRTIAAAGRLLTVLALARLRRVRVVWTVHNLVPHEARRPRGDLVISRMIAGLVSVVLAHSRHAARQVADAYHCGKVGVAFHGNYIGYYPPARRGRALMRRELGIPSDAHLILSFGLVRSYKRLPKLIAAFKQIDNPNFRLLIAGWPNSSALESEIRYLAETDPRIVLRLDRVREDEVLELHEAADVSAFAYRDIFSSGALMLALSCGLPVVVPSDTTATELGSTPAIQPYGEGELARVLTRSCPTDGAGRRSARATAETYGWENMAACVLRLSREDTSGGARELPGSKWVRRCGRALAGRNRTGRTR